MRYRSPADITAAILAPVAAALLVLLAWQPPAHAYGEDPDDASAVAAAAAAVAALGPSRGAVSVVAGLPLAVSGEVVGIVGLATGLRAEVTQLERAVQNLGATVTDTLIEVSLSGDVLFDFDRDELKAVAEKSLSDLLVLLQNVAVLAVEVEGHTDARGSESYNLALSERRARAVGDWLVRQGLDSGLVEVRGLGEAYPVAPNVNVDGSDNPDGRAQNRRVEILIRTRRPG